MSLFIPVRLIFVALRIDLSIVSCCVLVQRGKWIENWKLWPRNFPRWQLRGTRKFRQSLVPITVKQEQFHYANMSLRVVYHLTEISTAIYIAVQSKEA